MGEHGDAERGRRRRRRATPKASVGGGRLLSEPTAVVGRRGGAWFVDVVLVTLAAAVPALVLGDAYAFDRPSGGLSVERVEGDLAVFLRDTVIVLRPWELAVIAGTFLVAALLVFVLLPGRRGTSPGKLAADLRLVDADGERAGVLRALLRTLCWVVDGLPGIPLVAYAVARRSHLHQRIGDHVARTYVVDKRAVGVAVGAPIELDDPLAPLTPADLVVETEESATGARSPDERTGPDEPQGAAGPAPEAEPAAARAAGPEAAPARAAAATPVGTATTATADRPAAQAPDGVPVDEPIWDRRHRRYVMWHGRTGRWLEHVEDGWRPLD